jgi:adenylate cyclase
MVGGFVEVFDGRAESGFARIQRVIASAPPVPPAPGNHALLQRILLEACAVAGEARMGLATAERLLAMGEAAGVWEAEAHRCRADFLATFDAPAPEVEAEFDRALRAARLQGARSLELRAATSLLDYRLGHGAGAAVCEARNQLAAILNRFDEGRETADLRQASALLARA